MTAETQIQTVGRRTTGASMDYLPIAEHGIIGDLHSIIARRHRQPHRLVLLPALRLTQRLRRDPRQGARGYYRITPAIEDWVPKQLYSRTRTS